MNVMVTELVLLFFVTIFNCKIQPSFFITTIKIRFNALLPSKALWKNPAYAGLTLPVLSVDEMYD
jgi:hypothetical protein